MRRCAVFILSMAVGTYVFANEPIHHALEITLDPIKSTLNVVDRITLPRHIDNSKIQFTLHGDLKVEPNSTIDPLRDHSTQTDTLLRTYRLNRLEADRSVTIRYGGVIDHRLTDPQEESERSFSETPGLISQDGVFLASSTFWYPHFQDEMLTFSLDIRLPSGWSSVSQGTRTLNEATATTTRNIWNEAQSQDEIFLIAAPFHEFTQKAGPYLALAFLRQSDPALASRYLDATAQYLEMYSKLLGPYPYSKFALVENFWETGYGMPSFTLLGPQVIRFPFILHSSYPHEILHNWWGNGVFVDYRGGNWAEGLTAYLADHLLREQQGSGAEHRRDLLQKYTDYVQSERDFPLRKFQNRHSSASESIGYGKALMLFHMLRLELGDEAFTHTLRTFYKNFRFKRASWDHILHAVNEVNKVDYTSFFSQWLERAGAPQLQLDGAENISSAGKFTTRFNLKQIQSEDQFMIDVPVLLTFAEQPPLSTSVTLDARKNQFSIETPAPTVSIQIDSQFDIFRRLDSREVPAALSQGFGAARATLVLPSQASPALRRSYENLASVWQDTQQGTLTIVRDTDLTSLPRHEPVWLLGWENTWRATVANALTASGAVIEQDDLTISDNRLSRNSHSVVAAVRNPNNPAQTWIWIAADNPAAHAGLARKLPHYRKYSYLAFMGDEPTNTLKGQWRTTNSPLVATLSDGPHSPVAISPRPALALLPPKFSVDRLKADVNFLSDPSREGRGLGSRGIDAAADYIAAQFSKAGLKPGGDSNNAYFQDWEDTLPAPILRARLRNIIGFIPGTHPEYAGQSVVISAHYDHLGLGQVAAHAGDENKLHPGADDNASGVSVLLELARAMGPTWQPDRTVVFAAFSGEESGRRGSIRYVTHPPRFATDKIIGVINLDTVGRLASTPLNVLAADSAREWSHIFRGVGFVTGLGVNIVSHDIGSSDQTSFIEQGVPAVQLFATAHADFHRPGDTADKVDYDGLVKVATITREALEYLAQRPEPLTFTGQSARPAIAAAGSSPKRTGLGTVPDFSYPGPGVRISEVLPGSPAAQAGLRKNDVVTKLGAQVVRDLAHYAQILRDLDAGQELNVSYQRDGLEHSVTVAVRAR